MGLVYRGETLAFRGRVRGKRISDGRGEIDFDIANEKGDGTVVTTGSLTIAVPLTEARSGLPR